jgi:hydroxyacylglutathione hydrolase
MKVEKIAVGSLDTNCYLIQSGGEIGVIDPGEDAERLVDTVEEKGEEATSLKFVIATHFHWDHVNAIDELVERYDPDFYLGEKDEGPLEESGEIEARPDRTLAEGNEVELGGNLLKVVETPGHSPGSISLLEEDEELAFVGDLVFSNGFGRTDLPGGSRAELENSLSRLIELNGNWEVYPGHGPVFKLSEKIANSPFLADLKDR